MPTKSWLRQASDEDLLAEIDNDLNEAMSFYTVATERQDSGEYLLCIGPLEEAVLELQEAFRRLGRLQKRAATARRLMESLERGIHARTPFRAGMRKKITTLREVLQGAAGK